ncbi:hypothetical protein PHYBLDRAFT_152169 [Phycomyces blakesleeanus NRRL 1555(-)]|uniref:Uncharacterized protein n=1 Tax=Phycomyces blakesleeanus (strain ATCC 8743b / DSM 1359 / FGSC 10004 / NBRC 33097 / NRRL 1555) TaxID=763407 RepID=A0A162N7W5_PHYB8|nr:hypothetical protein PHYBLDRAFT_152169 [Phycomyces blakesleeanus NRRL 1555(-)]OAD66624.1 hypothetical protein PHYBLDRAFT_152169 [Phycomyces blakesleeanus NRRL 1555(-)]|eukprot:XP_018284664.1 hypothetical protein PHYBLDRAFT_152169 [Phycomyces blakesleeanus NRRL 1555(-)]
MSRFTFKPSTDCSSSRCLYSTLFTVSSIPKTNDDNKLLLKRPANSWDVYKNTF